MTLGLDIYRYQTVTNWQAVKNHGVKYIWVKLTDGNGPAIVRGDVQVRGAKSVGIPVGGYHYAQFGDPERQADVLLSEVERLGAKGLVPMLDLEAPFSPNSVAKQFGVAFCNHIKARGYRPGVYMNDSFARALRPDTWPSNPVVWIARYGSKPAYGGEYDVHQYSSTGQVPGITGNVDLNWAYTNAHFGAVLGEEGEDVTPAQLEAALRKVLNERVHEPRVPGDQPNMSIVDALFEVDRRTYEGLDKEYPSAVAGSTYKSSLPHYARSADAHAFIGRQELAGLRAAVDRLASAVAEGGGVTAEELKAAVATAIQENVVRVDINVNGQE